MQAKKTKTNGKGLVIMVRLPAGLAWKFDQARITEEKAHPGDRMPRGTFARRLIATALAKTKER